MPFGNGILTTVFFIVDDSSISCYGVTNLSFERT
jgi:hypothetical protein